MEFKLSKSRFILWSCVPFIIGVTIAAYLPGEIWNLRFVLFAMTVICAIFLAVGSSDIRKAALIGLFLFFGMWRLSTVSFPFDDGRIGYYAGHDIGFIASVVSRPEESSGGYKIVVQAEEMRYFEGKRVPDMIIAGDVSLWSRVPISYGDRLSITCHVENSPDKLGDSYADYIAARGLDAVCQKAEVRSVGRGRSSWFMEHIFSLRDHVEDVISIYLRGQEGSLAIGTVLGGNSSMDDATKEDFSRSGLTHLIAVSGLNITIMSSLVMGILTAIGLSRRPAFYFSSLFLLFYIILVGAPASANRAGIMGFLVLFAMYIGRLNRASNALWLTAALMLLANPLLLRGDAGFLLSFLAMGALIYIEPRLSALFDRWCIPEMRGIRKVIAVALSAQIATLPVIAYLFGQVSLVSVLANVLVEWTSVWILIATLVGTGLATILPPLGWIGFAPAWLLGKYVTWIAHHLGHLPYAVSDASYWPLWGVIVYYILLVRLVLVGKG